MLIVLGVFFLYTRNASAQMEENNDDLGSALSFSALSFSDNGNLNVGVGNASTVSGPPSKQVSSSTIIELVGAEVGAGGNIVLGNNGLFSNDVISSDGSITLDNYTKVLGQCVTNTGGTVTLNTGASCAGGTDSTGNNELLGLLSAADNDANNFVCDVFNGSPTESGPAINIPAGQTRAITLSPGLNFIDIPSLTLGNSSSLVLSAPSNMSQAMMQRRGATVVLRVDGLTRIGDGAKVVLTNGLSARQVVIATQGGISSWGNSSTINGTILNGQPVPQIKEDLQRATDPDACTIGSSATINGALLCEDDISIGANARIASMPASAVLVPAVCDDEGSPIGPKE